MYAKGIASVAGAYAQQPHQFLTRMLRVLVPDAYAQHVLKGLRKVHASVPYLHAEGIKMNI